MKQLMLAIVIGVVISWLAVAYVYRPPAALPPTAACRSDVNGDGVVDGKDLDLVKASFGKKVGQPGFSPGVDVGGDGVIDKLDVDFVVAHTGLRCSLP